ncbi:Ig-like domain-containing protein, partial [Methylobacterium sp. Leaf399]|uniref:Ig-like domain-containing protein n=1 Tax=Methylobacterium sp. Leaf399 TaxID=1736364 RepID=UPI003FCD5027
MAEDVNPTLTAILDSDTGLRSTDGLTFDPTIRGIATAGAVVVFADGERLLGSVTADAEGAYRFRPIDLTQGSHRITVTDLTTMEEAGVDMTLDTIGPTLGLALSSGTSTVSDPNGNQPLIQNEDGSALVLNAAQFGRSLRVGGLVGGVELGQGLKATVTLVGVDGHTLIAKAVNVVSNSSGDYYAFRIDRPADPALWSILDGTYTVVASVSDLAGNSTSTSALDLIIDTTADAGPRATVTLDGTGDGVVNASEAAAVTVTLSGLDNDSSAVATFTDGVNVKTVAMSANGTVTIDLSDFDGEVTTSLAVQDIYGNVASLGGDGTTFDTAAPAAPSLALLADTGASNDDSITRDGRLAVMATEAGGSLRYVIDGAATLSDYDPDSLAEGFHTVDVAQIDAAGNVSSTQTLNLTLDRIAPMVAAHRYVIAAGAEGTQVTIFGEVENTPGTTVRLLDGTTELALATLDGECGWSVSNLLGTGPHVLSSVATDLAGNVSFTPTLPHIAGSSVLFDFGLSDARITISADDVTVDGPDTVQTVLSGITRLAFSDKALLTSASYVLGDGEDVIDFSILDGEGSSPIDLTGNAGGQTITGNAGANRLDGGAGADVLQGGLGNDTYLVDNVSDRVIEATGGGSDSVIASVSYRLAAGQEIESLALSASTGGTALTITGNEFANALTGNDGDNTLNGGLGADTMTGGAGSDFYVVDDAG